APNAVLPRVPQTSFTTWAPSCMYSCLWTAEMRGHLQEMFSCPGSSIGFTPFPVTNWKEAESTKKSKNG
ncbi:hypothetical protein NDU88_005046, partial [Pleurodeles waltl]